MASAQLKKRNRLLPVRCSAWLGHGFGILKTFSTCLEVNELLQPATPALENLVAWQTVKEHPIVLVRHALGETESRTNLTQSAAGLCALLHAKRAKWPNDQKLSDRPATRNRES